MAMALILFALALVLLYKGGGLFVDAAVYLARRFRISELIIGATVVSIGTTIPETTVSALAAASGFPEIAYGNALGSVICNTALIAGLLVLLAPAAIARGDTGRGAAFFFGTLSMLAALTGYFGGVNRFEGAVLLACFALFILGNVLYARRQGGARAQPAGAPDTPEAPLSRHALSFLMGAAMLFAGSNLLINNGILIAEALGVPERVIALIFIALGTSLPELITAISAIAKGHAAVSLGNIIGANILNLTSVTGLAAAIRPMNISLNSMSADLLLAALLMALLTLPALLSGRTRRWQGLLLLGAYAWYCAAQMSGVLAANSNAFAPYIIVH